MNKQRIDYLDNLKVALIMLVVAHHAGQAYGSGGWWYFKSEETTPVLGSFFAVNAAFFMSLFFFISAYFIPQSYEKKGPKRFAKDRLKRLGIPILLGFLILIPILMYVYYVNFRPYEGISFFRYFVDVYFGAGGKPKDWTGPSWPDMQFGHLWFIQHLLLYTLVYVLVRRTFRKHEAANLRFPSQGTIMLFTFLLAIVTFVVRIEYPIDQWTGFLGFIQTEFAHVPQYVAFFVLGIIAYRNQWLSRIPNRLGKSWLTVAVALALLIYFGRGFMAPYMEKGGLTVGSLSRSLIETVICVGMIIGLLVLFREKFNHAGKLFKALSMNTFAVYFIHVPVVVALQYACANVVLPPLVTFVLVSVLGIILSFIVSHFILRHIPFLRNILY